MLKKRIKKTVKTKKRKKTLYFGKEAHQAIIEYQQADDKNTKHEIYVNRIQNSFDKLTENLIYIHGFSRDQEHFKVLKSDCVSFLYETLEKFDVSRGSKAFSYFNVCAKNFLIIRSKKSTKNRRRNVSMEDFTSMSAAEKKAIESYKIIPAQDDLMVREEDKEILNEILEKINTRVNNQNERLCIDAIIKVFENSDNLDFLNKRAIFVYLREISGLNPKQLSVAISNIRKYYREVVGDNDFYMLFRT
jgi:hypothetical protein